MILLFILGLLGIIILIILFIMFLLLEKDIHEKIHDFDHDIIDAKALKVITNGD